MSLFFDFHPDRYPPGSFQTPVQPPAALPGAEPLVSLCINQEWIPFILGSLNQLTMNTTWSGSDDEIQAARQAANNLILIFQLAQRGCPSRLEGTSGASEDYMIRQDPANPCLLQSSVDGVNWCTFADISKCFPNSQPAQGTQPTPPGGGCTQYTGEASIGHSWSLPNQVSTGDTVTVTNANGLWASPLDLFISRCPDGNLWFELACVDGTGHTEPGDPAPSINHDSLIGFDGTNYYDFGMASDGVPVTITIAGGISRANFVMMCNTPDSSGTGNVVFDIQYCNNAALRFSHHFDFTANPGIFAVTPGECGAWVPGSGFVSTHDVVVCVNDDDVEIQATLPAPPGVAYTVWKTQFSLAVNPNISNFTAPSGTDSPTLTTADHEYLFARAINPGDLLGIAIGQRPFTGTGQFAITGVTIEGTGPDPF